MTSLIVDVSVARSSGDKDATDPNAVACRNVLLAISTNNELKILMTREIQNEWLKINEDTGKKYASRFAIPWLRKMVSDRRVIEKEPVKVQELDSCAVQNLTPYQLGELRKDIHLFFAALAFDKKVISCDKYCWQYAISLKFCFPRIKQLHWINPNDAYSIAWIQAGAPDDPHWQPADE